MPMSRQPMILATKVPDGINPGMSLKNNCWIKNLAELPINPPKPTISADLIIA
jgi:hypothetical protein